MRRPTATRVAPSMLSCPAVHQALWTLAVATYGIGDAATTIYFVATTPALEYNPVVAAVIDRAGLWALVPWKAAAMTLFYGLYRITPATYRVGVPIGLVVLGCVLTAWNLYVGVVGEYPIPV